MRGHLTTDTDKPLPCTIPPLRCSCPRSDQLLGQLWAALPPGERAAVLERLAAAEGREKLPALKAQAAALAGKLRGLGA